MYHNLGYNKGIKRKEIEIMLEGKEVTKYFEDHPESVKALEGIQCQYKFPETFEPDEQLYRPITQDDIRFISFEGWEGQPGVYAWYYPLGVPHYCRIG